MGRSKSSHRWLQEHFHDEYVIKAKEKGYRSRAVFKLMEIQEKDRFIKPGMHVIDLGAAPGGWTEYARSLTGKNDQVVALDILPMDPIPGVEVIEGDFRENAVLDQMLALLNGRKVNVVLSDMAPNISGNKAIDQPKSIYLAELALDTARIVLVKGGSFFVKVFQGEGSEEFLSEVKKSFTRVAIRKPKASRPRSNEIYILARGFK